jgi:plastocyanin
MGLYSSGPKPAGATFNLTLPAGVYPYQSTGETTSMKGSVSVPVRLSPSTGTIATSFTVTLATQAPPSGYVFDVQIERPAATSFSPLTNATTTTITFSPDAGPGTYAFNARLRNAANGKSSGFSPTKTLTVSMAVTDSGFSPTTALIRQRTKFSWLFPSSNTADQTVTDGTGLGLFDSGFKHPGSTFTFTFTAAGSYRVIDAATANSATVNVALGISPLSGSTTTPFTVLWSSAPPPSGDVFDIQVQRPGGSFTDWLVGQTATSAAFTPDAGTGTYSFQARLRNTSSGATSGWSPPTSISVS